MLHPGIAQFYDAGTTPDGRPYFAMEHVAGLRITDYCDRHRLGLRARLHVFRDVCLAVQHAHQKGIIHRDLKPGNVLVAEVDGRPQPKIIDFGVAKATAQRLTERTIYSELNLLIGTPECMSPERRIPARGSWRWIGGGHLQPGRNPLRAPHRPTPLRRKASARGRLWRDAAHPQGGGAAQSQSAGERAGWRSRRYGAGASDRSEHADAPPCVVTWIRSSPRRCARSPSVATSRWRSWLPISTDTSGQSRRGTAGHRALPHDHFSAATLAVSRRRRPRPWCCSPWLPFIHSGWRPSATAPG